MWISAVLAFGMYLAPAYATEPKVYLRSNNLPKKAKVQPQLPPKQVAKQVAALRASNPVQALEPMNAISLSIFPANGNVALGSMRGIVVSPKIVATRLGQRDRFQNFSRRVRALFPASQYVNLNLIEVDLVSGWMLFQAAQTLPIEAPRGFPKNLPGSLAADFGYSDYSEMNHDWDEIMTRLRPDRQAASKPTAVATIERELANLEQSNLLRFVSAPKKIEVESFTLAPFADNFICQPGTAKIESKAVHQFISGATSVNCKSPGAEGVLGIRVETGVLDFWSNRKFSDGVQSKLLTDIAAKHFEEHRLESEKIENSTHSICQKTKIRDDNIEVHYCTRTLRSAPAFQDTVAVFGKKSRQRFLYTTLRTGALSEAGTKRAVESILSALEENP